MSFSFVETASMSFSCAQTGSVGTRLLSSRIGDLGGRKVGIAGIIGFTKNPSELFGAVQSLSEMVQLIAVRSHGGALPRKLGRSVFGVR
jgi:hypothetical protein